LSKLVSGSRGFKAKMFSQRESKAFSKGKAVEVMAVRWKKSKI